MAKTKSKSAARSTCSAGSGRTAVWRNRIVGHADCSPHEVIAHDLNWRSHPDAQRTALKTGIGRIGFIKSVTISKRTGRILDGHLRITLALEDNQPTVPVEYVDLDEAEEREALLTLDSIAAMARAEQQQLQELSDSIQMPEIEGYADLVSQLDQLVAASDQTAGDADDGESTGSGSGSGREQFKIVVTCDSERQQCRTLKKLNAMGLNCNPV